MSQKGYVYILTNPSMPGLVKIGKTIRDVEQRANELYQTGVPTPFVVEYEVYSPDCGELEAITHKEMAKNRVSSGREFFRYTSHDADRILEDCLREQVEAWLEEFIPDQVIVNPDEQISIDGFDPDVYAALDSGGAIWPDFSNIIHEISGDDIKPAIKRWAAKVEVRKEKMAAKKAELNIVVNE